MYLVRSGAIEGYADLVRHMQQNPGALLERTGLSEAQLREPDALISYERMADLLALTSEQCRSPFFSMQLAASQTPLVFGDLAMLGAQQQTLRGVFETSLRHLHVHAMGVSVEMVLNERSGEIALNFAFSNAHGLEQLIQLSVGQMFNQFVTTLGRYEPGLMLHLRQSLPTGADSIPEPYQHHIVFGSYFDGVEFPSRWLERSPAVQEREVRDYFQRRIQLLERIYPDNLPAQTRYILSHLLASGESTLERVSATLNLHPRVLQRRLASEGCSFRQLLQECRLDTARHYLRYTNISITELALNLGYAEVAVFSRHFRQWTGMSPREWQREVLNS